MFVKDGLKFLEQNVNTGSSYASRAKKGENIIWVFKRRDETRGWTDKVKVGEKTEDNSAYYGLITKENNSPARFERVKPREDAAKGK